MAMKQIKKVIIFIIPQEMENKMMIYHYTSHKMPGWMNHNLESRLLGEISVTSDTQMTHPYGRKQRKTREPLDESERGE